MLVDLLGSSSKIGCRHTWREEIEADTKIGSVKGAEVNPLR